MNTDFKKYMKRAIELAKKSHGCVSPNPLVGAVVLDKDGNVIGEGRHERCGEAHAEVNALKEAGEKAKGGTIIVNLEPCSHYGKTPPCADLIVKTGIKRVVVGMVDPNPRVSGNGIKKCRDAGIEVITGVLEKECEELNEIFIKNQLEKKPFIAIKTAVTTDGKIAAKTGDSKWVTGEKARKEVHKLRNKYDAILTGSNTVKIDNPKMNCRIKNGRSPIRVIVDSNLTCDPLSDIFIDDGIQVYIAVSENINGDKKNIYPENVSFIDCPLKNGKIDLSFLMQKLFEKGIMSILVEAGGILNGAVLKEKLADKLYFFMAPKILGDRDAKNWVEGINIEKMSDTIKLEIRDSKIIGSDIFVENNIRY